MSLQGRPLGLRERTKHVIQNEIANVALRLFLAQGFDTTTMEQIAEEADISRRSLFRYFGSKEDIVLGHLVEAGVALKHALETHDAHEPPWVALRAALQSRALAPEYAEGQMLAISKMIYETPSLHAGHLEKQRRWRELLVPNIQMRLGLAPSAVPDPRALAIVACALACLDVAMETWVYADGDADLAKLYDEAVAAVRL